MLKEKLKEIIKIGECETLDFKENFDKDTIETVGAFSNLKGGIVLVGVADNGIIKGVQIGKETINDWVNQISQSSNPRIIPDIEEVAIDGKNVVVIGVKECPIKPVAVKGKCFRRVNSSNRLMTPQEIANMHYGSIGLSWDLTVANGYSLKDIDEKKVYAYRDMANKVGRRKILHNESVLGILNKLEFMKTNNPTWSALLLFGKRPKKYIQQAVIHCGRFKNETLVIDDDMIEGCLTDQIEKAMEFIKKNIGVKFVMTGEPKRRNEWDYPLDAIREALVNAVCHRDYTDLGNTEVRIFDDRLVISNPGELPQGFSVEDLYKPHNSKARNKGIAKVFFDIGFIEQWGSGIGKMVDLCKEADIMEPKIEEHNGFTITFSKDIYTFEYLQKYGLNERQIKAVLYVKENGRITNKEYQKICQLSERSSTRDLKQLVKLGLLEQKGNTGKGTEYIQRRQRRHKDAIKAPKTP